MTKENRYPFLNCIRWNAASYFIVGWVFPKFMAFSSTWQELYFQGQISNAREHLGAWEFFVHKQSLTVELLPDRIKCRYHHHDIHKSSLLNADLRAEQYFFFFFLNLLGQAFHHSDSCRIPAVLSMRDSH